MKIIRLLILTLLFPVLISTDKAHEYYVSVTNIEYVEKQKSVQIINQIFIDDFEKIIQQRYDESIELATNEESDKVDVYIKKYLAKKLKLKINTNDVSFNFLGKEYKDDMVYSYLEIDNIPDVKTIEIKNHILFDLYSQQQNILRTKIKGKDKSFMLIKENSIAVLNFD